jgi:hypothetical protein
VDEGKGLLSDAVLHVSNICLYIPVCIIYVCMYTYGCKDACMYIHMYVCICMNLARVIEHHSEKHIYMYMNVCVCVCVCVCVYISMYTYIYVCTYIHTCIHAYMHICIHTCEYICLQVDEGKELLSVMLDDTCQIIKVRAKNAQPVSVEP